MKSKTPERQSDRGRKIDLIVTDLGGTLVKTDEAIMAAVRRAAEQLQIPEGYADPVYDVFGTSIGDTDHDVRQAQRAGVLSAAVQTGGQAVKSLRKIRAQNPDYLLDSFARLREVV
jgi:phosphoglycolate phosphatase-like HAD superfamily hydrolase